MKIIQKIADQIKDELCSAKKYAKAAVHYKSEQPQLAAAYHEMSEQKMNHALKLHTFVVKFIEEERAKAEPPAYMIEMWQKKHNKIMGKVAKVKVLQQMYKG